LADIFLSYCRRDLDRVEKIAAMLKSHGYSIWWDRDLVGGTDFSHETQHALESAKAVVVVWSKEAVASAWVRDEASLARSSGSLISICIEDVLPPLGFQQYHAIDFKDFSTNEATENSFRQLFKALDHKIENTADADGENRKLDVGAVVEPISAPGIIAWIKANQIISVVAAIGLVAMAGVLLATSRSIDQDANTASADQSANTASNQDADRLAQRAHASIAVLPLTNLTNDVEQEFFALGVSSEVQDRLVDIEALAVTALTSSFAFKDKSWDVRSIGKALNVNYLLDGNLRKVGSHIRVVVQLIETQGGTQLWSEEFEGDAADVFKLEEQIARKAVSLLSDELVSRGITEIQQPNARDIPNIDPLAYEVYLRASAFDWLSDKDKSTSEKLAEQRDIFRTVTSLAPEFVDGWLGLAHAEIMTSENNAGNRNRDEALKAALAAMDQASKLAPDSPRVNQTYARIYHGTDNKKALQFSLRATTQNPNMADAWAVAQRLSALNGRYTESFEAARNAFDLDPLGEFSRSAMEMTLAYTGKVDEALELIKGDYDLPWFNSGFPGGYESFFHAVQGRHDLVLLDGARLQGWVLATVGPRIFEDLGPQSEWIFFRMFESAMNLGLFDLARCWGLSHHDVLIDFEPGRVDNKLTAQIELLGQQLSDRRNGNTLGWRADAYVRTHALHKMWPELVSIANETGMSSGLAPPPSFFQVTSQAWEVDIAHAILKADSEARAGDWIANISNQLRTRVEEGFDMPVIYYDLARVAALASEKEESLKNLELAIDKGWRSWRLEFEPAFDTFRDEEAFREIKKRHDDDLKRQSANYKAKADLAPDDMICSPR